MTEDHPRLTEAPARKALGQHFLFDPSILKRAANAAGSPKGRTVIEVGPGPGGLTRAILNENPARLIAVETDPRFSEALLEWPEAKSGQLVVIAKDARKVRWEKALEEAGATGPAMMIGNLPYNVGTPLLVDWLKAGEWRGEMALMFQKEVAERICAKPDTDAYGRLAVLSQAVTRPYISFTLPPGAFRPPPKVDSAVAVFEPLSAEKRFAHIDLLEQVAGAAFGQRRKMLRAALKPYAKKRGMKAEAWLEDCGIDPTARAETLTQGQFRTLAASLA
jgi:16S rRNA (adenine1518-N6/adenine1519-N6)-dimethyltransferase